MSDLFSNLNPTTRAPAAAPQVLALPSMVGVVQLLDRARSHGLAFPKLWLQLPDETPVRISIAGAQSRTPGFLMLTDGQPFGGNRYFGRISPAGVLELGRDGHKIRTPLIELLTVLASDPAKVASEYGHLTGNCCFCARKLKDERSIEVGYGRICADKFELPWGL